MYLSLFFVGLLGFCAGWNFGGMMDEFIMDNKKHAIIYLLVTVFCLGAMLLNAHGVVMDYRKALDMVPQAKVEQVALPQQDTTSIQIQIPAEPQE